VINLQEIQNYVMDLLRRVEKIERDGSHYFAQAAYTSTSWDGDAYSTTARTLIDLSAVFGVPAGVKAVDARISCKDSASGATPGLYMMLTPNTTPASAPLVVRPSGLPNGYYADGWATVPCNADGDLYVEIGASGAGTLNAIIEIWGWWI
jgi:hypothetical protein